jgi:membrane glycosyltransferase
MMTWISCMLRNIKLMIVSGVILHRLYRFRYITKIIYYLEKLKWIVILNIGNICQCWIECENGYI